MGIGNILIQISTAMEALPVSNSTIKVVDFVTGETVFESKSGVDQSGRSPSIMVEVPSKELSLDSENTEDIPYGIFNISVSPSGYNTVNIEGVQVFEGITSIQNISVNEAQEVQPFFMPTPERIVIPPNQLLLNTKRDRKIGLSEVQPFVLREVYIPEYITVHLGTPASNAENVTVSFVDYIKNVASSEIYPTWPEQSLRANIYTQISFALNRVYTEWYRNKGYPFQITNSTAYDQFFVKGRNIFDNISNIVDQIFNEYFSLVNSTAPYFTQYCNGTTSKCPGLSQWGTVDLANLGKNALDILQYYYGNDKILKRTSLIAGIPESYPGSPIRLYDRNSNVTIIQQQLNRVSQNYPAIPKIIPVDGIFGRQTEASVKTFQRVFNLLIDGIVGRGTWYKLSGIYTAVKRLAELDQEVVAEGFTSILNRSDNNWEYFNGKYPDKELKYGDEGEKVRELQLYMKELGDYYGIPYGNANGKFDNNLMESVVEFQKIFKLNPSGIVDMETWKKIYQVFEDLQDVTSLENLTRYPGYVLKKNFKGSDIKRLQTMLKKISKSYNHIPDIGVNGEFDGRTQNAVFSFQREFFLLRDGKVGINTWRNIVAVYLALESGKDINQSDILFPFTEELKYGDINGFVSILKEYMNVLAKNNYPIRVLPIDSVFDKATEENVKRLQKVFALNKTGIVDEKTWNKIALTYDRFFTGRDIRR